MNKKEVAETVLQYKVTIQSVLLSLNRRGRSLTFLIIQQNNISSNEESLINQNLDLE